MDRFDKQINIHYNGRSENVLPDTGTDCCFLPLSPGEVGSFPPLPLGEGIQKTSNHTPRNYTQTDRTLSPQQLIYYRELTMDILKHGAEVEVIAPEFLREAVIKQIAAMQKMYKK